MRCSFQELIEAFLIFQKYDDHKYIIGADWLDGPQLTVLLNPKIISSSDISKLEDLGWEKIDDSADGRNPRFVLYT